MELSTGYQARQIEKDITSLVQKMSKDNKLSCASAHKAAKELGVPPCEIGGKADLLALKITRCQLGLFGYKPEGKKIDPAINVPGNVDDRLNKTCSKGRVSCLECWNIANDLKVKRLDIASACEKKKIKIKPCQLGAF